MLPCNAVTGDMGLECSGDTGADLNQKSVFMQKDCLINIDQRITYLQFVMHYSAI